jgi:inorganic pyrophosphatase
MVKITNGTNVFEVTRGAFDGIYSHQGYTILDEKTATDVETPETPEKTEDEKFLDEIIEKPISQWSNAEVKRFAALKEIDITGTKNANEAKDIIKGFIEADSQE